MDFSKKEVVEHNYTPADGQEQGVLSHEEVYQSNATDASGGVPGTDSNSETDYMIDNSDSTNSSTYERKSDYLPNEKITTTTEPTGTIVYTNSSVSAAMVRYKILKEEDAQLQGFLDGVTWDEYKLANAGRTKLDVDADLVSLVANATGIPSKTLLLWHMKRCSLLMHLQARFLIKYHSDRIDHYYPWITWIRSIYEPENQERSRGRGRTLRRRSAAVYTAGRARKHRIRTEV